MWEIIIVLAIMVILANIGIPALANITQQRRSEVAALSIADSFRYARSEALRRNTTIYLCAAKVNVNDTLYGCDINNLWSSGVLSFVDYTNKGQYSKDSRVKFTKFESSSASIVSIKSPAKIFKVDPRSVISIFGDKVNKKSFCFELEQRINGKQVPSVLMIDSYGNSTYCKQDDLNKCNNC